MYGPSLCRPTLLWAEMSSYLLQCPMFANGKNARNIRSSFFARPAVFQANHVTKVEVPNSVLTCNMRNKFVTVSVYQAV